jgi:propionyl-CoA carboxylase beta chain
VTHEAVTKEDLGGAMTHASKSGVAHLVAPDEEEALLMVRELVGFMPSNNMDDPPAKPTADPPDRREEALKTLVPLNPNKPYDIKDLVRLVVDDERFFEVHEHYAPNIVVGFARFGGFSTGIVANQPAYLAGCLDTHSSKKAARFIRFCDAFNIPLVTFVDVPGFLPGTEQEFSGIIKDGAKLLFAYAESTVPKITIITRKAYGGAYDVMSSKHIRGDVNLAYPTAEIAVMGPDGAVNIIFRNEIQKAADPDRTREDLVANYRKTFANPYQAAALGYIDAVIYPEDTRRHIIQSLKMLQNKRQKNPPKKHGNIPL